MDLPFSRTGKIKEEIKLDGIENLNVLVVDDEEYERKYISIVLDRIGVCHTCVEMPNETGVEVTKRVREHYGEDVVVIVVSAYEHNQANDQAKQAGANLFLSKPLFQSSLFNLFMRFTGGQLGEKEISGENFDFSGKRVLIAEDNEMNQTVVMGILKKYGVEGVCADDGQIAVNMFVESEAGYYDAILMDIQMPNMNGLDAARAIRGSEHPNAKTIQIIALTADAFNEDIARTLSAGMNAHVSKPIESELLAKALEVAFHNSEK